MNALVPKKVAEFLLALATVLAPLAAAKWSYHAGKILFLNFFPSFFETGSCTVAQAIIKLMMILLSQPPECWEHRHSHHTQLDSLVLSSVIPHVLLDSIGNASPAPQEMVPSLGLGGTLSSPGRC